MSHADQARERLQQVAVAHRDAVRACVRVYAERDAQMRADADLVEAMQHTLDLILAAEDVADCAAHAATTLRAALAETMADTGATTIRTETHGAHLATAPARALVEDQAMIPPHLMRTPEPRPDLGEIRRLLCAGETVRGATLINNGAPTLVIRAAKGKKP